ncbi:hypothetical protein EAF00_000902 [Botryotinia globosa]|nr:hypothetical protein EAF00_000902 [Botryotinia globosa]
MPTWHIYLTSFLLTNSIPTVLLDAVTCNGASLSPRKIHALISLLFTARIQEVGMALILEEFAFGPPVSCEKMLL